MNNLSSYFKELNVLYLQKAIDVERLFTRNIVYLSLGSIVVSLLFLKQMLPAFNESTEIKCLWLLFMSWGFYFLTLVSASFLVFFSAVFKDVMFEGTIQNIVKNESNTLHEYRSHWSGAVIYRSAAVCTLLFLIALALLLIFLALNIYNLEGIK